ncbi:MAG TPA: PAS domain S-box protein [Candidatus Angelobacter sp.]|nr:PAS domain S-box protein [Candidatus Angelobacter sp.]
MSSRGRISDDATKASEQVARLEREVAELRRQLAAVYSQASDRLVVSPPDESQFFYSEARYRALIELSPQAVWLTDRDGKNTYCNRYWYEYSGMTVEQAAGSGWAAALDPEDMARNRQGWQSALARGVPYEAELRFRRKDGQDRWHLCRSLPLKDANGQVTKWMGIAIDIHDRKIAAAAIAQANERMLMAVESAQAGTWDYYPATHTLECTEHCRKIFHLAPDEVPTLERFFALIHPKDRQRVAALVEQALSPTGTDEYDADYRVVWPDGTVRWVLAKGKCFFSGEGPTREAVRFSGMLFDVTERKKAERDRTSLAAALQHSPDFIGITDLKGQVLFLNRAGQKMVGLRDDAEARSKTAADFLGAAERSILEEEILPLVRTGGVWEREFSMRHFVTGEPILVETRVFGILDDRGRLTSMANLSRDISEKRKLEERLQLAQKMDAVGRLAGGIAHDFNNLLTIIRGAAEVLLEGRQDSAANRSTVKEIDDAAERAAALTEQLLAFGRRQMIRPRAMDLNLAIVRVQSILQRLAGEDIAVEVRLDESLGLVKMDPIQVDQILINLTANARDAMPGGGSIAIRSFNWQLSEPHRNQAGLKPGHYVCLSYSDNGLGMSQEIQSHIFEPFYTTKTSGHGLGLATVYGIVQQSGGQILVRSAPGEGTAFTLYLPVTTEALEETDADSRARPASDKESILLVEDEPSLRAIVAGYMRECGYAVHEAANAQEARAISSHGPIDLLLTDIVMPGASGPALASALAGAHAQMKVIFMSGYADHAALEQALTRPNTLFVQKPFRLSDLMAKIRQALTRDATRGT